jgi:exosortase E/protease (VPEID-CTERM system)
MHSDIIDRLGNGLVRSLALLATLLGLEWIPISAFVATGRGGNDIGRGIVIFASIFCGFGYLKAKTTIQGISDKLKRVQFAWGFFAAHVMAMLAFLALSSSSMVRAGSGPPAILLNVSWFVAGALGIVFAGFAFVPQRLWLEFSRATGNLWVYAALAGASLWKLATVFWFAWNNPFWRPLTDITFNFVQVLLRPFSSELFADRATLEIGTQDFHVIIGPGCSGFEGAGLMLVFSLVWLWLFRRECRFPRALLLIPAGMCIMFVLNAVRISALILIGSAGAPGVAVHGFHSQAGWIAFNAVALGFSLALPRVSWMMVNQQARFDRDTSAGNPTVPYLLPFAAILAAAMISRAASAGFEWLYPLRFFSAAAVVWFFRRKYKELNWRPGWLSPLVGFVVFLLWLALAPDRAARTENDVAAGLASLSGPGRIAWLVFRVLAAVATVPIAEELAFRGYLLRRLICSDFESVGFQQFTYFALIGSSVAFGVLHGNRWLAGAAAGLMYGMVMVRRGSIGDAVVAHATTNALLAVWVLWGGNWQFW